MVAKTPTGMETDLIIVAITLLVLDTRQSMASGIPETTVKREIIAGEFRDNGKGIEHWNVHQ